MNNEIKKLYKINHKLAKDVAKVLGFNINVRKTVAKKDTTATNLSNLISTVLGFKPKKIKVKKKDDIVTYSFGELVEEGPDQIIIKLTNDNGKWKFVIGIPIIKNNPFLKSGKAEDEKSIFELLEKNIKQAKNFIKVNDAKFNKNGEIVLSVVAFKNEDSNLRKTLEKMYEELDKKQNEYQESLSNFHSSLEENNIQIPKKVEDLYKNNLSSLANFKGGIENYFKEDLLGQFLLQDKIDELKKLIPYGWTFKSGKFVKEDGKFTTGAMILRKNHIKGDPLIYIYGFSADSNDFDIAIAQNQKVLKQVKGIPLSLVKSIIKEYSDFINKAVKNSNKEEK